ncbi:MAG: tRNA preQ1(34) S-adenosylmethionine ribosyltransferase-isomerase QueA [Clostridiales bacterium]|jgi:S-adenosylmethionine:tRNA ribosyltransferase-isomerase|nr:tRNA preQ1(34) S-adenosylmethionine ribosyltransferase-isomerase QueA [Clostridiales bacterium]
MLKKTDYDYNLPKELIAQKPLKNRSDSRMLVLNKTTGEVSHKKFTDITDYLSPGDCMVFNNTRVIPARLLGETVKGANTTGGSLAEVLLLKRTDANRWEALVKPGKKMRQGAVVSFGGGKLQCRVIGILNDGIREVEFSYNGIFEEILDELGEMPLPPYITEKLEDKAVYQTVYAKHSGAAAAPTAGLHFTEEIFTQLSDIGVKTAFVTLHVGLGTFRPVKEENITNHKMHSEWYEIDAETANTINAAKVNGKKVIAIGTTTVRTLESAAGENGIIKPQNASTDIFIFPGYKFKVPDAIVTNFHLPQSTLIMLISAYAGRENVLCAYNEAVKEKYRFFSFGDCCLLL